MNEQTSATGTDDGKTSDSLESNPVNEAANSEKQVKLAPTGELTSSNDSDAVALADETDATEVTQCLVEGMDNTLSIQTEGGQGERVERVVANTPEDTDADRFTSAVEVEVKGKKRVYTNSMKDFDKYDSPTGEYTSKDFTAANHAQPQDWDSENNGEYINLNDPTASIQDIDPDYLLTLHMKADMTEVVKHYGDNEKAVPRWWAFKLPLSSDEILAQDRIEKDDYTFEVVKSCTSSTSYGVFHWKNMDGLKGSDNSSMSMEFEIYMDPTDKHRTEGATLDLTDAIGKDIDMSGVAGRFSGGKECYLNIDNLTKKRTAKCRIMLSAPDAIVRDVTLRDKPTGMSIVPNSVSVWEAYEYSSSGFDFNYRTSKKPTENGVVEWTGQWQDSPGHFIVSSVDGKNITVSTPIPSQENGNVALEVFFPQMGPALNPDGRKVYLGIDYEVKLDEGVTWDSAEKRYIKGGQPYTVQNDWWVDYNPHDGTSTKRGQSYTVDKDLGGQPSKCSVIHEYCV